MTKQILIVDDNNESRRMMGRVADQLGLTHIGAEDGKQAVQMIRNTNPDLILLDLLMSHMDGFGVLNYLQSSPTTRKIPVIVVTSMDQSLSGIMNLPGVTKVIFKGRINGLSKAISETLSSNGSA